MSARKYETGDLALVEAGCWANPRVALRLAEGWSHTDGVNADGDGVIAPVRPLLVIDPEDRDQVEHFVCLLADNGWTPSRRDGARAALRAMLEPTAQPRPDEPTDIGSWVTDGEGSRWILMPPAYGARRWCRWYMSPPGTDSSNRSWTDLALPVTVGEPDKPKPAMPPDLIDTDGDAWVWGGRLGTDDAYSLYLLSTGAWGTYPIEQNQSRADIERRHGPVREVPHRSVVTG